MTIPVSIAENVGSQVTFSSDACSSAGNIQRWHYLDYWIDGWIIGTDSGSVFHGGTQIVLAALTTYLVCMPLILIFGQIRGAYLGGSILAFFLGYMHVVFQKWYPCQHLSVLCCADFSGI